MMRRDVLVVGASAGGLQPLRRLVSVLHTDLPVAVLVVMHLPAEVPSHLPEILGRAGAFPAHHPRDGEPLQPRRIYVAPPDRHMLLEFDHVVVASGPRENRFRPSIDALFRSAAYTCGTRVVGVLLSGALDDGVSGLWTIKRRGGVAIVQSPAEAAFADMPLNALKHVAIDHVLRSHEFGPLLQTLLREPVTTPPPMPDDEWRRLQHEVEIAAQGNRSDSPLPLGEPSGLSCPECHGPLGQIEEAGTLRFRCQIGHAYTAPALLAEIAQCNERLVTEAIRSMRDGALLLGKLARRLDERGDTEAERFLHESGLYATQARTLQRWMLRQRVRRSDQNSSDAI